MVCIPYLQKKIIYDFDDALWLTDRKDEAKVIRWLKWRSKIKSICQWSYKISCGNDYLKSYATTFNRNAIINPTTIDTTRTINLQIKKDNNTVIIGWTGTHSTLKYLQEKEAVLIQIQKKYPSVEFVFISDIKPFFDSIRFRFIQWNLKNEIDDLISIDIGIMPLPDDPWTRGKCGFKALQFMALGIPCVASPVGVNSKIVEHNVNGMLASSDAEWITSLSQLIENKSLRNSMGVAAKEKIHAQFSLSSNSNNFLDLFS
ncbi:MAG: glycosyltransferase family 4 protein [Flammeovirgaceae bacterium]|nr:glycosyltransferase family 4 protein [Flammeovirgaceae bacterium]